MTARTLVLDVGYQPHRIVNWQRAVELIFGGKAQVVESYDEPLMTDDQASRAQANGWTLVLKIPAVVRLLSMVSRKKVVRFSRMNVLTRDNWTCQYCGKKFPTNELSIDHVIPRSRGGKSVWTNVVCSCTGCNGRKGGRLLTEAAMKLTRDPVRPVAPPVLQVRFGSKKYQSWRHFITDAYWSVELKED